MLPGGADDEGCGLIAAGRGREGALTPRKGQRAEPGAAGADAADATAPGIHGDHGTSVASLRSIPDAASLDKRHRTVLTQVMRLCEPHLPGGGRPVRFETARQRARAARRRAAPAAAPPH